MTTIDVDTPLTPLEVRFVQEFLKDMDMAKAAARAGSKASKNNMRKVGWAMANKANVAKAIQEVQGKMIEEALLTETSLIKQLQATATEARLANKFDAAVKCYIAISDICGFMGEGRKIKEKAQEGVAQKKEAKNAAFISGEESEDMEIDINQFLGVLSSTKKIS